MPYELAALLAALCWTIGGVISTAPARAIGGWRFTQLRMTFVFFMLLAASFYTQGWTTLIANQLPIILLSGLIGIFIGDTALFSAMGRLGPRRTAMLFSTNAPMTALIGYGFYDESMSPAILAGSVLVSCGVFIAIAYGKRENQSHHLEDIHGVLWVGVALGLLSALGQSVGSIILKPVLAGGADPVFIATLRTGVAAICLWTFYFAGSARVINNSASLTPRLWLQLIASGVIGMAIGMTLLLYAFAHGSIGVASILSSTNPIMILPLLWLISGERPANGAWLGALLAIIGTAFILK